MNNSKRSQRCAAQLADRTVSTFFIFLFYFLVLCTQDAARALTRGESGSLGARAGCVAGAAAVSALAGGAVGSRRRRGFAPLLARVTVLLPRRLQPSERSVLPSSGLPSSEGDSPPTSISTLSPLAVARRRLVRLNGKTAPLAHINICTHRDGRAKARKDGK